MQEKELRLAIICTGGISLAVYMHGITKEILKLIRASALYHELPDTAAKQARDFADTRRQPNLSYDTEEVYFNLLRTIGKSMDLRVVVDVIAGASAGGINGVMLARALAHDLPFDSLREMWLKGADVDELVARQGTVESWSRKLLMPLISWVARDRMEGMAVDEEVSSKLLSMLQIARLRPPFDGEKLLSMIIEAMNSMGAPRSASASLLPTGHELELFVTLTDFFGYSQSIPLYDPPVIHEREHRHLLRFAYRRYPNGEVASDFKDDDVPGLAFAARATSSFPGVFSPAQLGEVDNVLGAAGKSWTAKEAFLASNFARYLRAGSDPMLTSFIDGSVLNNKPFSPAIRAIEGRSAFRKVDRRLVYINPNPAGRPPPPTGKAPGVLRTLKGSLSDIPRNEPIYDDLTFVRGFNQRVRRNRTIIDAARPDIAAQVEALTRGKTEKQRVSTRQIARWRDRANALAGSASGFAYKGYVRLKLSAALESACEIIGGLLDLESDSAEAEGLRDMLQAWAQNTGALPSEPWKPVEDTGKRGKDTPPWLALLRGFDMDFRKRRLRFVIQGLNRLYTRLNEPAFAGLSAYRLDYLKGSFYEVLDALRNREGGSRVSLDAANRVKQVIGPILPELKSDPARGAALAEAHQDELSLIMDALARDLSLENLNYRSDDILSSMERSGPGGLIRSELLTDYIGFAFWDILTFTVTNWRDQGEYEEIRVVRVSPQDCNALREGGPESVLKGVSLGGFGAFFRRVDRENDYLWGRLHGADRMIDILYDAAFVDGVAGEIDRHALKKQAFECILRAERDNLPECGDLIDQLLREVKAL